jgi:predicted phosphodiesterase
MTSRPAARLTWLHLSDFHLRKKIAWSQDVVLKSLLEDVRGRYAGSNAPDLLFLTGDIAFSGKVDEYLLAEAFVAELRATLSLPPERICVVPGNHDIDRDREEDAFNGARSALKSIEEVDRFFANEGRRRTLFARQEAFRAFANKVAPPTNGPITASSYAHRRLVQVGAIRVRALLLDSAWLSEGGEADAGSLLVGEQQVIDCALNHSDPACLTFALLHHPFAWLTEFEQLPIENRILDHADICLRGHVHAADMRAIDRSEARLTTFTAGAAFTRRTADNTYSWCSLDLQTGSGEHIVHRYVHADHRWHADEKRQWHLLASAPTRTDHASVRSDLAGAGARWPSFCACLVSGLQSEVPLALPGGPTMYVSFDAAISGLENTAGALVAKLRHHFYWREVWNDTSWKEDLHSLVLQLNFALQEASPAGTTELATREQCSQAFLDSQAPLGSASLLPALIEVQALIRDGNAGRAREVIDRWRASGVLRPEDALELDRLNIFALLAENKAKDALEQAELLLGQSARTPADVALAARCALEAEEKKRAAELMHGALDEGFPIAEGKMLAIKIAGAAGDKKLTARALK